MDTHSSAISAITIIIDIGSRAASLSSSLRPPWEVELAKLQLNTL
jgi:hypothetical protein